MDLAEKTIMEVILEEFEMYHAHLRLINKKPNYGWLRNMYHSLSQQMMRRDPKYFAIYCALRPDQNTNLVLYPYYAKYAHEGDNTFFRHIDLNIRDLASSGRGANMIQGTVSLDDERPDDCTMILPGMHKYIKEWTRPLPSRCEGLPGVYSTIWCLCYKTNKLKKKRNRRRGAGPVYIG
jgi:hypothetical protein